MIPPRRLGQPGISVRILRGQGGWGTGRRMAEADPGKGGQPDCCCARLSATAQRLTPRLPLPPSAGPRRELFSHSSRKNVADIRPTHFF